MHTLGRWGKGLIRLLISAGATILFYKFDSGIDVAVMSSVSGIVIGLAGTLLGFLITALSLMTALTNKVLISNMIKTGHFNKLASDTVLTCVILIIVIILSLVTLLSGGVWVFRFFCSVIFFTSLSFIYLIEAGKRFSIIITNIK